MDQSNLITEFELSLGNTAAALPSVKPEIKSLNYSHTAIARWLVENPDKKLKECAAHFGYSQSWLSIIIHSDAFQVVYRELQKEANAVVLEDVPAKLRGILHNALDGLGDAVDLAVTDGSVAHRDFLLETSDKVLNRLGFGAKAGSVTINQNAPGAQTNVISSEALERSRARLQSARANEARVIDVVPAPTPAS